MKTTFFHDTIFIKNNGEYYTKDGLNQEVLNEYIEQFQNLTIVSRLEVDKEYNKKFVNEKNKINNVKFIGIKHKYQNTMKQVKNAMKDTEFAIIRMPSFVGIYAMSYASKYKKKYLVEYVQEPFAALWYYSLLGKIIAPFIAIINKIQIKKAPYVLYVTEKYLQKKYKTDGISIGCSDVRIEKLDEKELEERINKIDQKDMNKNVVIGTLAAINIKYKGHKYVLKAISNLQRKGYHNITYQLVGSGTETYIKRLAKKYNVEDNVQLIGQISHSDIFSWLKNVDIYIQPSNIEGLSRALVEAMSVACPTIASDVGGNPELIEKDFIFKKANVRQLQDKIEMMINNKELMKKSAMQNFEKSKSYENKYLKKKRKDFYEMILNKDINK